MDFDLSGEVYRSANRLTEWLFFRFSGLNAPLRRSYSAMIHFFSI